MTKAEQELMAKAPTTSVALHGVAICGRNDNSSAGGYVCTLMSGHIGPHIAHGVAGIPFRVWEEKV